MAFPKSSLFRLLALTFLLGIPSLFAQRPLAVWQSRLVVANEIIIKLKNDSVGVNSLQTAAPVAVWSRLGGATGLHLIHSNSQNVAELLTSFAANPNVQYAEPNHILHANRVPNDERFSTQWALKNNATPGADVSATAAWDITTGSRANVVGVVDTGVDYNHPDLAANIWSAPSAFTVNLGGRAITCAAGTHGFNAITMSCNPQDDHGHGTHVSGIIGAVGNNAAGVTGINWTAQIMGLKFIDNSGSGSVSDAINAIEFAIQAKAAFANTATPANVRVLSNSWGGDQFSQALLDEINRANTSDMLFVVAAGNSGADNDTAPSYPGNFLAPNQITVAATDSSDSMPAFSNFGRSTVHLGAPGGNILSTLPSASYGYASGTSMAAPQVSGAAVLLLSVCSLNTSALKSTLLGSTDPVAALTGRTVTGGRLNVSKALNACATSASGSGYALSASPSSVAPGGAITVTWTAPATRTSRDWIGLYQVGAPNTSYISLNYTGGTASGSLTLTAPASPGQFEYRYIANDSLTTLATSNPVTVSSSVSFTLNASPSTVSPGDIVTIAWTAPESRTGRDWIGLYRVGSPAGAYLSLNYTGGAGSGTLRLAAPATAGQYEYRYLLNDSLTSAAVSNPVTVSSAASFNVTASPASVAAGDTVTVSWTAPAGRTSRDWIGLYQVGAPVGMYRSITYTSGAETGTLIFVAPTAPGQYEYRYMLNDSLNVGAVSNTVTVASGGVFSVTAPASATPSSTVAVSWTAPASRTSRDWIGLYLAGAPAGAYLSVNYTGGRDSGTLLLGLPAAPGRYEYRYLLNDSLTSVAASNPFDVR